MRGAVGLKCPHFHFAKPLTTVLGLAAQRLLGDQGVRAHGASVDFVGNQVIELHHVDVAHDDFLIDFLTRTAVKERTLARIRQLGFLEVLADFLFRNPIEHGGSHLESELFASPAQVGFKHLPDVHA